MASDTVLLDITDGVATVTLNQPDVRNALTPELRVAFRDIMGSLEFNDEARCVVITGAGDHFMAGGDIRNMVERLSMEDGERRKVILEGIHLLHLPLFAIRRMGKPVIASIKGAAAGFGVGLVAACRTLGMKHQMELALLGDRFSADRAKELGLINWHVPKVDLQAETLKLATRLANGPTVAYANAKKLFNAVHHLSMESQLQMEAERMADSMLTEDHAEGITAFMEKRKPVFKGR
jgi:2-(1,2-epoxy-1,2-dihydrophenyl)acetyl-CoA isomerase